MNNYYPGNSYTQGTAAYARICKHGAIKIGWMEYAGLLFAERGYVLRYREGESGLGPH
jgi:hypothetical protein